jgi:hypothetical protein
MFGDTTPRYYEYSARKNADGNSVMLANTIYTIYNPPTKGDNMWFPCFENPEIRKAAAKRSAENVRKNQQPKENK